MELTLKDKKSIFWALLNAYSDYERGRKQARELFGGNPEKLKEFNSDGYGFVADASSENRWVFRRRQKGVA
jgi:hypothetical protein